MNLKGRDFLTLKDFSKEEIMYLIDLAAELNKFFKDSKADGSMEKCAEKYKVQAALTE